MSARLSGARPQRPLSRRVGHAAPKRCALPGALVVLCALCFGCAKPEAAKEPERVRPVRTVPAVLEQRPVRLSYVGTTGSAAIKRYAFKQGGRLLSVRAEKGARVKKGQVLAVLDPADLELARKASQLSVTQAEEALADAERTRDKLKALVEEGARPANELERAQLNVDVRKATLEQARVDVTARQRMLSDTRLVSEVDGFVVDVLHKAGELVGGGYPVVIVRTERQVVHVGVSQRDVKRLRIGTEADVQIDDVSGRGRVSGIAQIPDRESRTYEVEVELGGAIGEREFYIGSIARVGFEVGTDEGIWVPIPAVLTEGESFVFTVREGRAAKRAVVLGAVSGPFVQVEGLSSGDEIIVEGMKTLKEGYRVEVRRDGV